MLGSKILDPLFKAGDQVPPVWGESLRLSKRL